jgi:glutaredoxin
MSIKSIEVICIPCAKCERMKKMIIEEIKAIEVHNRVKIAYDFKHTANLRDMAKYSVNASQTPIVVINGQVELCG